MWKEGTVGDLSEDLNFMGEVRGAVEAFGEGECNNMLIHIFYEDEMRIYGKCLGQFLVNGK